MSPRHHPSDDLLVDYAAGGLAHGPRLVIASHLGACAACSAAVRLAETVGGLLMDDLAPTPMHPDALARAMAQIDRPVPGLAPVPAPPADWIKVPADVLAALRGPGRRSAFGAWVTTVAKDPGTGRTYLIGMAKGRGVARHTHSGREMTCVLKGSFVDDGVVYGPGDFTEHDGSVLHAPQATRDEDCVCLLAATSRLTPVDWVGRLAFPILGF
jgi:putative transcriptional regulator